MKYKTRILVPTICIIIEDTSDGNCDANYDAAVFIGAARAELEKERHIGDVMGVRQKNYNKYIIEFEYFGDKEAV